MKDELVIRIMKGFIALRRKMYTYLTDYGHVDKKAKGTKKCVIKRNIKFQDYKDCLENKNSEVNCKDSEVNCTIYSLKK